MRVDEGRNSWNIVAIKTKACTVVGRGGESLFSDPGYELRLGREKEKGKCKDSRRDEQKRVKSDQTTPRASINIRHTIPMHASDRNPSFYNVYQCSTSTHVIHRRPKKNKRQRLSTSNIDTKCQVPATCLSIALTSAPAAPSGVI